MLDVLSLSNGSHSTGLMIVGDVGEEEEATRKQQHHRQGEVQKRRRRSSSSGGGGIVQRIKGRSEAGRGGGIVAGASALDGNLFGGKNNVFGNKANFMTNGDNGITFGNLFGGTGDEIEEEEIYGGGERRSGNDNNNKNGLKNGTAMYLLRSEESGSLSSWTRSGNGRRGKRGEMGDGKGKGISSERHTRSSARKSAEEADDVDANLSRFLSPLSQSSFGAASAAVAALEQLESSANQRGASSNIPFEATTSNLLSSFLPDDSISGLLRGDFTSVPNQGGTAKPLPIESESNISLLLFQDQQQSTFEFSESQNGSLASADEKEDRIISVEMEEIEDPVSELKDTPAKSKKRQKGPKILKPVARIPIYSTSTPLKERLPSQLEQLIVPKISSPIQPSFIQVQSQTPVQSVKQPTPEPKRDNVVPLLPIKIASSPLKSRHKSGGDDNDDEIKRRKKKKGERHYGAWSLEDRAECLLAMTQERRNYREHLEKGGEPLCIRVRRQSDLTAITQKLGKNGSQVRDYYYRCVRKADFLLRPAYGGEFDFTAPDLANEAVFHFHRHVEMLGLHLGLHFKNDMLNESENTLPRFWKSKLNVSMVTAEEVQAAISDAEALCISEEGRLAELLHASLSELLKRSTKISQIQPKTEKQKNQCTILGAISLGYGSHSFPESDLFDVAFRQVANGWSKSRSNQAEKKPLVPMDLSKTNLMMKKKKLSPILSATSLDVQRLNSSDKTPPKEEKLKKFPMESEVSLDLGVSSSTSLPEMPPPSQDRKRAKLLNTAPLLEAKVTIFLEPLSLEIENQISTDQVFQLELRSSERMEQLFEHLEGQDALKGKSLYLSPLISFREELKWTRTTHGSVTIAEICASIGMKLSDSMLRLGYAWRTTTTTTTSTESRQRFVFPPLLRR